jgi:hypothetical protein
MLKQENLKNFTFTWNSPASFVWLNSITDSPTWGDERDFSRIIDITGQETDTSTLSAAIDQKSLKNSVSLKDEHDYLVVMYVNNDVAPNLELNTRNARASVSVAGNKSSKITFTGTLSVDNIRMGNLKENTGNKGKFGKEI